MKTSKYSAQTISTLQQMRQDGKSYGEMFKVTGVPRGTIPGLIKKSAPQEKTRKKKKIKRNSSIEFKIRQVLDMGIDDTLKLMVIDGLV